MKKSILLIILVILSQSISKAEYGPFYYIITTDIVVPLSGTSAEGGGIVYQADDPPVTKRGIIYGLTQNPELSSSSSTTEDGMGDGAFISSLEGLTNGATYYVKAYAINSAGVYYGEEVSFVASQPIPTLTEWAAIIMGGFVVCFGAWFAYKS